jgi:hypothetical protein
MMLPALYKQLINLKFKPWGRSVALLICASPKYFTSNETSARVKLAINNPNPNKATANLNSADFLK